VHGERGPRAIPRNLQGARFDLTVVIMATGKTSTQGGDRGGPRLAVRECAASRCPTDHTKTDRPALIVRGRTDACARYSRGRRWGIGPTSVGIG
jgi:hypothetical protein